MLAASAASHPGKVAVRSCSGSMSFHVLDTMVSRCAALLQRHVERPGTVIAITSVLSVDFIIAYYGVLRSGNVAAPINPFLRGPQLAQLLGGSAAEVVLVDPTAADRISEVRDQLPKLREVLLLGSRPQDGSRSGLFLRELLKETMAAEPVRRGAPARSQDVACLHFTSGTTGAPKTVRLSHRNVTVNAAQVADAHRISGGSVMLNHLPTFHPMHMNSAILAGVTQVLCESPDPVESLNQANRYGATHYYSLPPRLAALANSPLLAELGLETVRVIASGGSALPPKAAHVLSDHFGIPVIQGYGLAETSPLTHSDGIAEWVAGTVGRPVADTECRIVDVRSRAVLGVGEPGEVQLRGPQVMLGYAGESTPSAIDDEGWLSTGDVGRLRPDGRLVLVDRLKDVFKRDNWLVSPSAVEQVVLAHPDVVECVVVDHPDPSCGAVATAFVVLAPTVAEPAEFVAALATQANDRMPYYQQLEHIEVVASIPRSPNGKVPRAQLRARMAELLAPPQHPDSPPEGGRPQEETMVTFITTFTLKGDAEEFERLFEAHAKFMSAQPGFLGYRMVRSKSNPAKYVNVGHWASPDAHRGVVTNPEFGQHVQAMRPLVDAEGDLFDQVSAAGLSD
jgi:long-chain acyl-CoA synthetase